MLRFQTYKHGNEHKNRSNVIHGHARACWLGLCNVIVAGSSIRCVAITSAGVYAVALRKLPFKLVIDSGRIQGWHLAYYYDYYYTFNIQGRQLRPGPSDGNWQCSSLTLRFTSSLFAFIF